MPAATPDAIRQQIWQAAQQGQDTAAIAHALGLPLRTARHLLARFRTAGRPCPPRFDHSGRCPSPAFAALRMQVVDLRRQHPRWGAERILAQLLPEHPGAAAPAASTVRRWLAQAGLAPGPRPRAPTPPPAPTARRVHEIWPMDACEKKPLRDARHKVCWLRLLDEASGAALFTRVYDQPSWAAVGASAVQAALRHAFDRWGRPEGLRVDNGYPWVCPDSDLPSDLELWLAGLGVALHKGRPHVPQDNPRMERSQRTAQDWAEPWQHDTAEQLQRRLDEEDRIQREVHRFDGQHTRLEVYPELRLPGRAYAAGWYWEALCWDHQGALRWLGQRQLTRKVDQDGCVSLYDHSVPVQYSLRGQVVAVCMDAASQEWVFTQAGAEVRRCYAPYLSAENIRSLQVRRRPGRSARQTRQRHAERPKSVPESAAAGAVRPANAGEGPQEPA